jgi:hypothetical protein
MGSINALDPGSDRWSAAESTSRALRIERRARSVLRRWLDERLRLRSGVGAPAARQPTDRAYGHVAIAQYLTRQPDALRPLRGKRGNLGLRVTLGLTGNELDAAGRAPRAAAARVQLVDARVFFKSEDKALQRRDIEGTDISNGQQGHGES